MSLARLAALARRGATPVGVTAEATQPAFDPLVVLDAAATGTAARTQPRRGDVRAGPPSAPTHGAVLRPPAPIAQPPALLVMPAAPATPATARAAVPPYPNRAVPVMVTMPSDTAPSIAGDALRTSETAPHDVVPAVVPAETPIDPIPRATPPRLILPSANPVATPDSPVHTAPTIETASAPPPLPTPHPVQPTLRPAPDAAPPAPALVTPSPEPHEPTITIGRIDVVMAPPPSPPPAPTAARAPDRGFTRYAAMRSARDRARW